MFALVYADAKTRADKTTMKKVGDEYIAYTEASISYSEAFARALEDEAYRSPNTYVGDDGSTWLLRWAASRGGAIHVDRPEPSQWIQDAYRKLDAVAPPRIPGSRN